MRIKRIVHKIMSLLALTMILSCAHEKDAGTGSAEEHGAGQVEARDSARDQRVRINIVTSGDPAHLPDELDGMRDPYVRFVEEHTQLDMHFIVHSENGYQEKLNALIQSDHSADVILMRDPIHLAKYVKEGLLLPLDELIRLHAPDLFDVFPDEAWEAVTFQGNIYAIPSLSEVAANEIIYARKDWLDALGLEPPRTLEQYYEVMRAFTYDDPDQNGKDDTWGLTIMPEGLARTAPFFGAFGVPRSTNPMNQWKVKDGELEYSSLLPEAQEAINYLSKLYGDGILDREFALNKQGVFYDKIVGGQVGLFSASWDDISGPLLESKEKDPSVEWIRLAYPIGKDGQSGTAQVELLQSYSVVPVNSKHGREIVQLLHFIAGEGYRTLKLGFEHEEAANTEGNEHVRRLIYTLADSNDVAVRKERLDLIDLRLNDNVEYVLDHVLPSDFRGPSTPSIGRYGEKLINLEEEAFVKMIMGIDPSKDFDDFVKEWIREGGWEIRNEVNAWYRDAARRVGG